MKKKIVKKTIRRRKKGSSKNYFTKETHDNIRIYQNTESDEIKHKIYVEKICPAFNKLAENLIFINGFAKTPDTFQVLKNDCVTFLYETIRKFDPDRGTKAFSYFNVVAKNWLIIQSKKRTKIRNRTVSIQDAEERSLTDPVYLEAFKIDAPQDKNMMRRESFAALKEMLQEIKTRLRTEKEIACIDAIIALFDKVDDLDLLNKRAIFVYLRDISSLSPKQLSVAMSSIRKHYRDISKKDEYEFFFGE